MAESKFSSIFSDLTDPRVDRTKRHKLLDILGLTIIAVLCGADNWVEVAEFGKIREEWLKTFLELPNGIPSHDTLGRVFSMIDGAEFERCFVERVRQLAGLTSKVIAVDGKTIRGSSVWRSVIRFRHREPFLRLCPRSRVWRYAFGFHSLGEMKNRASLEALQTSSYKYIAVLPIRQRAIIRLQ